MDQPAHTPPRSHHTANRKPEVRPKWPTFAVAGATAVGAMWAAAFATGGETDPKVGTAAWVAAAVIGTAAVISAGAAERPLPPPPPPLPPEHHE